MVSTQLGMLFRPGRIGRLELKNRVVVPPMGTGYPSPEGSVTGRYLDYLKALGASGAGLVVCEATLVAPWERPLEMNGLRADSDALVPGLSQAASAIRSGNAHSGIQLMYIDENIVYTPIPQRLAYMRQRLNEKSAADIEALIRSFAGAARRACRAGFDYIEIHCAHGTELCQFLSSAINQRRDRYGGDAAGRAQLAVEVLEAIKCEAGGIPVGLRINVDDFLDGGNTVEDAIAIARRLEATGADLISLSAGFELLEPQYTVPPMLFAEGWIMPYAAKIKANLRIPLMVAGRIHVGLGEAILRSGEADYIGIGRGLFADPGLVKKAEAGRADLIRRCLACNYCLNSLFTGKSLRCMVNAGFGMAEPPPAKTRRKVLVVGGGIAGMEAARVAALRGHRVTLIEKDKNLGGQFRLAAIVPDKGGFYNLIAYLETQLRELGVDIQTGRELSAGEALSLRPEAVVLATGAVSAWRELPGSEKAYIVQALDALAGRAEVRGRVVVVGAGLIGIDTAEWLAQKGLPVSLTSRRERIGEEMMTTVRKLVLNRLRKELGVAIYTGCRDYRVSGGSLEFRQGEAPRSLPFDTIVMAGGMAPADGLAASLRGKVPELFAIGDCVEPRNIAAAIREGWETGGKI